MIIFWIVSAVGNPSSAEPLTMDQRRALINGFREILKSDGKTERSKQWTSRPEIKGDRHKYASFEAEALERDLTDRLNSHMETLSYVSDEELERLHGELASSLKQSADVERILATAKRSEERLGVLEQIWKVKEAQLGPDVAAKSKASFLHARAAMPLDRLREEQVRIERDADFWQKRRKALEAKPTHTKLRGDHGSVKFSDPKSSYEPLEESSLEKKSLKTSRDRAPWSPDLPVREHSRTIKRPLSGIKRMHAQTLQSEGLSDVPSNSEINEEFSSIKAEIAARPKRSKDQPPLEGNRELLWTEELEKALQEARINALTWTISPAQTEQMKIAERLQAQKYSASNREEFERQQSLAKQREQEFRTAASETAKKEQKEQARTRLNQLTTEIKKRRQIHAEVLKEITELEKNWSAEAGWSIPEEQKLRILQEEVTTYTRVGNNLALQDEEYKRLLAKKKMAPQAMVKQVDRYLQASGTRSRIEAEFSRLQEESNRLASSLGIKAETLPLENLPQELPRSKSFEEKEPLGKPPFGQKYARAEPKKARGTSLGTISEEPSPENTGAAARSKETAARTQSDDEVGRTIRSAREASIELPPPENFEYTSRNVAIEKENLLAQLDGKVSNQELRRLRSQHIDTIRARVKAISENPALTGGIRSELEAALEARRVRAAELQSICNTMEDGSTEKEAMLVELRKIQASLAENETELGNMSK